MSNLNDFPIVDERAFVRDAGAVVGRGGFGTAYLAHAAGKRLVIKELHARLQSWYAERFAREARTLAQLDHPSIVRVMQLGRWRADGPLFYAMEYVEGAAFDKWLEPRSLDRQLENLVVLADVARAVDYAHRVGVIHRDLKPSNVIVRTDRRAVVIDWGFAGEVEDGIIDDDRIAGSFTRHAVGSPFYMSPEQALGQAATPAMDVYSFGAMLYELLRGDPPFRDMLGAECSLEQARTHAIKHSPTEVYALAASALIEVGRRHSAGLDSLPDKSHAQLHRPVRSLGDLATRCLDKNPLRRPAMEEVVRVVASAARWCVCAHCHRVALRTDAVWHGISWKCNACRTLEAFDDTWGIARQAEPPVLAPSLGSPVAGRIARAPSIGSYDGLVRGSTMEERDGVRSTHATDELGREVVIEELLPEASAAQRATFSTAMAVLATSGSPILPKVFRSGPTMFVREHVTGKAISELAGRMDIAAVRGLRDLCQSLVALHRKGIACGGLPASTLIVPEREAISVTIVDWRRIVVRPGSTAGSFELPSLNRDAIADTRSVIEILAPLFATPRWPDASKLLAALAARRSLVEADLERVAVCLGSAVCTLRCRACNAEIRVQDAFLTGLGYTCSACTVELSNKAQTDFSLHLADEELRVYRDRHRQLYRRMLPATIGLWILAFIAEWYVKDGARFVLWAGGAVTAKAAYHRISAREYARGLQRRKRWIAPGWLAATARGVAILVIVACVGATVTLCGMCVAGQP